MISVKVKNNESIDRALRRFKRKCQQAGLFRSIRESRQFTKPSDKRKMAKRAAIRRHRKQQRNQLS